MTMLDRIQRHAGTADTAITFLPDKGPPRQISRSDLEIRARSVAVHLATVTDIGDRVLVLCPPGIGFVSAFLGCMYSGVVAVPGYPPNPRNLAQSMPRLRAIARDTGAVAVVAHSAIRQAAQQFAPDLKGLRWIDVDAVDNGLAAEWKRPDITADTLAFIQYTSGSTAEPKGVCLSHGNLAVNDDCIAAMRGQTDRPVIVSWLPPFHDMGLIGSILHPLSQGFVTVQMAPHTFLRNPVRWLAAIGEHRGTCTPTPNFALDFCSKRIAPEQRKQLDLSSLRRLIIASEPVRADTLDRFAAAFAPSNFRPRAFYPGFGLAEATVYVAGVRDSGEPRRARGLISCGRALTPLRIVDEVTGLPLPEGEVGEIWVRGGQVASGYYHDAEPGTGAFGGELEGKKWLRTGDLGFLLDRELYVAGRIKDLIIARGRNLHPQDVEATASSAHPMVRTGCVVAFSVDDGVTEQLVVVVEVDTKRGTPQAIDSIVPAVQAAIAHVHDLPPDRVVGVPPRSLLKTSSGKLRRRACRELLLTERWTTLFDVRTAAHMAAPPASPAPQGDIYPDLSKHITGLDERSTRYRFDLDRDIAWDQLDAPGAFIPPALVRMGWSEAAPLRDDPTVWDVAQWSTALALCDIFVRLEQGVIDFVRVHRTDLHGDRRSLNLLVDDELKHIAMFRRFAEHLRGRRPDLVAVYDRALDTSWTALDVDGSDTLTSAEYHYRTWLQILFFEEWTIWFFEKLNAERSLVQPAWLSVHRAHSREEAQHVKTDEAWLAGLSLSPAQKRTISRRMLADILRPMQVSNHVMQAVCCHVAPHVRGQLTRTDASAPLLSLLRQPRLRKTREHSPFFAELVARALPSVGAPSDVERVPSYDRALSWLTVWLGDHRGATPIELDATFAELGLDSAELLLLGGEIEQWLGGSVRPTLPYELPTPRLLAGHLASLRTRDSTSTISSTTQSMSARQRRWLDLADRRGGLAHTVTEVFVIQGRLDDQRMDCALRACVAAHPVLGSRFVRRDDRWQLVHDPACAEATQWLRVHTDGEVRQALAEQAAELYHRPFSPLDAPFLRAVLVRGARGESGVVLSAPHCVADGVSMALFARQLAQSYAAPHELIPTQPPVESPSPDPDEVRRRLSWWSARLHDLPGSALPRADRFEGRRVVHNVNAATVSLWQARADQHGVSLFVVLLAALHLAWRDERDQPPVIATQLSGRTNARSRALFGYLVDVAIVRTPIAIDATMDAIVPQIATAWLEAVQHSVVVDTLVEQLFPERLQQRWLPAPILLNVLPASTAMHPGWTRTPELIPTERTFLFYDEMLLAQEQPDGGVLLVYWYDAAGLSERDATAMVQGVLRHAT